MKARFFGFALLLPLLAACSHPKSQVGEVDVERVISQWPEMQKRSLEIRDARNTLQSSAAFIDAQARAKAEYGLGLREAEMQVDIVHRIQTAAQVVAQRHGLKLIVTRDYVAYAGIDITNEVRDAAIAGTAPLATPTPKPVPRVKARTARSTRPLSSEAPITAPVATAMATLIPAPTLPPATAAPSTAPAPVLTEAPVSTPEPTAAPISETTSDPTPVPDLTLAPRPAVPTAIPEDGPHIARPHAVPHRFPTGE